MSIIWIVHRDKLGTEIFESTEHWIDDDGPQDDNWVSIVSSCGLVDSDEEIYSSYP